MNQIPNYIVLDVENNTSEESIRRGRKAGSPWFDELVAIGLKNNTELKSYYIYGQDFNMEIDEDVIVGHNLAHDLLWFWDKLWLQNFFKRGGRIWDTQVVHYILSGQQEKYPALRDIAVNKYGCPDRIKYIERLLFDKNTTLLELKNEFELEQCPYKKHAIREEMKALEGYKQLSDLPKASVLKDVQNDVLDTEQVFLQQLKKVQELKLEDFIRLQMDAVCATIECSFNGMKIDINRLNENKQELEKTLKQKEEELLQLVTKYWR